MLGKLVGRLAPDVLAVVTLGADAAVSVGDPAEPTSTLEGTGSLPFSIWVSSSIIPSSSPSVPVPSANIFVSPSNVPPKLLRLPAQPPSPRACRAKASPLANLRPHFSHICGRSPVWSFEWRLRSCSRRNLAEHC